MARKGRRALAALAAFALAAALAAVGLAGCSGSEEKGSGTLTVGVRSDIVNFGLLNEQTGKYYGLEIDIAEEMAERMGYADVEYVTVTPDDRKEMLLDGKVDALVACYSIADSRLENFDFSPAYYTDHVIAVVENSALLGSIDDMKGLTFGTMSGANAAPLLSIKLAETSFSSGVVESASKTTPTCFSIPGVCCSTPPTRSFPAPLKRARWTPWCLTAPSPKPT